jgi:hypothetical protein
MRVSRVGKAQVCALFFFWLLAAGCGTIPSVRPVGEGERSVALSSGGPITEIYGATMPIPYAVLRYRYGLREDTDLHLGIHPTMSLLGNVGVDVGMTKHLLPQRHLRPSFSVEGSVYGFWHVKELASARVYPEMSVFGGYDIRPGREAVYFAVQNMFQAARPYVVSVPLLGTELPFGGHFVFNLEGKWYAPLEQSDDRAVDYSLTPFAHGALGLVLGGSYNF